MSKYVIILVILDDDLTDFNGIVYPTQGFIKSLDFVNDTNILNGLQGILWGKISNKKYINILPKYHALIKVDSESNIINIDKDNNYVKFESGLVVYNSKINTMPYTDFVSSLDDFKDEKWQLALNIDYANCEQKRPGLAFGVYGQAISNIPGIPAIAMGDCSSSLTNTPESHAIGIGRENKACALEDYAHSVVLSPFSEAKTVGNDGHAIAVDFNSKAISIGSNSISVCLGVGGKGSVGEDGILIMAYLDKEKHLKISVAYEGKDIEQGIIYYCDENGIFQKV